MSGLALCPTLQLQPDDYLSIAQHIASGMKYLAEKEFVHGYVCSIFVLVGHTVPVD